MRPSQTIALSTFLSTALALCPDACNDYLTVQTFCANTFSEAVYGDGTFSGSSSIECMCGNEVIGDVNAIIYMEDCYNCDYFSGSDLNVLEAWIIVCETYFSTGVEAARECWNSNLEEGCAGDTFFGK
jgi:hypothetical protein